MIGSVLQRVLDEKEINVAELARNIGISSQTIYSIIKRDNMKVDLETLLKICDTLDVSIEIFYKDYTKSTDKNEILSKEENSIISIYRTLNKIGKQKIYEYINDIKNNDCYNISDCTIEIMKAARSEENAPRSISSITPNQLSRLKNAPSVYKDTQNE